MTQINLIADYGTLCGEGPLWSSEEQALYWTDIADRKLYRCQWPDQSCELLSNGLDAFEVGGIAHLQSSGFIVVNSQGVWRWVPGTKPKLILNSIEGSQCALNDCIADPEGRIFTGSCFFTSADDDYERGCLFRFDTDGTGHIVDEGISLSNGLGFSPDEHTLYYTDSAERIIYAYDYRRTDGSIRNRRKFVKVPTTEGLPDGLTVDAEGYVWSAQWFGGCIVRYDPDGKEQQRIAIPAAQTSSLTFGGPDLTDIFVTSASLSDALSLAPPQYSTEGRNIGGQLYHLNLGIRGKEEYKAKMIAAAH
jgi:sugar lactone lactonase YvrE